MADEPQNDVTPDEAPVSPMGRGMGVMVLVIILVGSGLLLYTSFQHMAETKQAASVGPSTSRPATSAVAIGGPFTLTDQNGRRISDADLKGKSLLVFFGYTFCPDICPTALTEMSNALDVLGAEAEKITPVFITIDPARDTPEHLKEYADFFHPRLVALTGTDEEIKAVAKSYRIYYAKAKSESDSDDPKDYLMDHSSIVYLMGPDGAFRAHFSHGTDADTMANRIREYL